MSKYMFRALNSIFRASSEHRCLGHFQCLSICSELARNMLLRARNIYLDIGSVLNAYVPSWKISFRTLSTVQTVVGENLPNKLKNNKSLKQWQLWHKYVAPFYLLLGYMYSGYQNKWNVEIYKSENQL